MQQSRAHKKIPSFDCTFRKDLNSVKTPFFLLRKLEKRISRGIETRTEINEMKKGKQRVSVNPKSGSLKKKKNEINDWTQIISIRNERGITTNPINIKKVVNSINLDEMDKFIAKHKLPQLIQGEIKDLYLRKQSEIKKATGPDSFTSELYQTFEENNTKHTSFQKMEAEERPPNSFYALGISLIPKPPKDNPGMEDHRPTFLMKIESYVFNKISANQIQ